jgi:hypothetical protein
MISTGMRCSPELLDALSTYADTKGMSRNALIVQILTKATKAKTTKSREQGQ